MQEKVFIQIYKNGNHITDQDVSGFTTSQVAENIRIKEKCGLECRIKRVSYNDDKE